MVLAIKEVILPSGGFARVRPLTGRDLVRAMKEVGGPTSDMNLTLFLICLSVTIDEQPVSYEQLLNMDYRDCFELCKLVQQYSGGPIHG